MTDTFRAMCAELVRRWDVANGDHDLIDVADAMDRTRTLLAQAVAGEPTDQEIAKFLADQYKARMDNQSAFGCPDFDGSKAKAAQIADARAVLARWGRPTPQPVAVSERLPGPEDCIKRGNDHWCWGQERSLLTGQASARWRLMRVSALTDEAVNWLPANALPTPEGG